MCGIVPLYSDLFVLVYDYGPSVECPCIWGEQSWTATALGFWELITAYPNGGQWAPFS